MIIRWALGLRSGSRRDLNHLTGGTPGRWFAIAFALYLAPVFLSAQTMPAPATSEPAGGTSQQAAGSAAAPNFGACVPTGYVLRACDQGSVEVFGADGLRAYGSLNLDGNVS